MECSTSRAKIEELYAGDSYTYDGSYIYGINYTALSSIVPTIHLTPRHQAAIVPTTTLFHKDFHRRRKPRNRHEWIK